MTGAEHYTHAEMLLESVEENHRGMDEREVTANLILAQVHATLAVAFNIQEAAGPRIILAQGR